MQIKTERLILRPWLKEDWEAFAALNADPRVMEWFLKLLSREESDQLANRISTDIEQRGWGLWAVSLIETDAFIGYIGLDPVHIQASFTPAVEIGWRLKLDHWGKGYATEGALASLDFGFNQLGLQEIVAYTTRQNMRSKAVMERIGMQRDPQGDFEHPKVPEGHPLRRHVLYRIKKEEFDAKK
jgi:3-dehydroquinate dehydratase/shikimate dehydrogenase